jgi:uncharacterized protein with HEPN domain
MKNPERDQTILEHMLRYCMEIESAHQDFGVSRETFEQRSTYRNAISLCLLQIGELSNHLSDHFKQTHSQIPWRQIRGMRNFVAHQYGSADTEILWIASTEDVVSLKQFCKHCLNRQKPRDME